MIGDNREVLNHREPSWSLATDLYQLTMAQGYWASAMAERDSIFHMFYRTPPFGGRYVVAAGIEVFADWLSRHRFSEQDCAYLATVTGANERPLFTDEFLRYLAGWTFRGSIEAVAEGTLVFPHEPMVRVRAPLFDAQLIETTLLAIVNYQSLVATKASRIRLAAGRDEVLEFGLRRAHGLNGGLSASRAAYIGGIDATSNVLAGQQYGIPVRGTHAHSWIMAFADELTAFHAYCQVFPHNSVLLVDTYDSLDGVRHAIDAGRRLRERGEDLLGIRLDSGDLVYLAGQARKLLDDAGFQKTRIVASGDLDEQLIVSLKGQGAPIDIWGVGTKLATAFDEPALGGVYKLAAVTDKDGILGERMKLSDQASKASIPGCLDVVRLHDGSRCVGDIIFDSASEEEPGRDGTAQTIISPVDPRQHWTVPTADVSRTQLLQPLFVDGRRVAKESLLSDLRQRTLNGLTDFDRTILRFDNPHTYAAGLSARLHARRERMRENELAKIHRHKTNGYDGRRQSGERQR
ncbi:nicotinate phosphoribosyltransferase [Desulfofustis glycolicus]|uniref:Nicotinate phosphoribosyltransferase n=1 Tax=Desulfofustis glycolicus DSM 9705 TaxID=1121409 RepID=A0A1M5WCS6_9BACT|nr:nicotinate phosphoribosyltransferase [Desulfofustis glycolicus]MCB2217085.1 nicotinate phosphoribosyltransferase [Desulfobulbaceae bacterium]SHH85281.1 nicotinate phosphoribosyltransferase [Desulfofustis glycolicus DSM 9705]